ncbi:DUF3108 domain-containing protein [Luteibaculum oceani]|nr:DUF3108 domain-containing protein [Luteibaculum oceani]
MKWISSIILTVSIGFIYANTNGQNLKASADTLRKFSVKAYKVGEELDYVLHYGLVNAGVAKLKVEATDRTVYGRPLLHLVGTGRSVGAFNWFFKVRDRYESYLDANGAFPWIFIRRVNEGGYEINQDYKFYQHQQKVETGKHKVFDIPEYTQDMLSAFYYARTLNFDTAKIGDVFTIPAFVDDEYWPLKIKYLGSDVVSIRNGKFKCRKFVPVVQKGRIFKDEEDLNVWITADKNNIPVLIQAKVLVGSIKMELTDYKGLAAPISKID